MNATKSDASVLAMHSCIFLESVNMQIRVFIAISLHVYIKFLFEILENFCVNSLMTSH